VDERVLVGPWTGDDAGVYLLDGTALVATADFITPLCDDPRRYGRVAAANSLSDVYAMGGRPLFVLNLCCFPEDVPVEVLRAILEGAGDALREAGAALLGGHTVTDPELKFGMAVIGRADPERLMPNSTARPGDRLVLTKPLGTGVLINAFRRSLIGDEGLEPALVEMERLNERASELALAHGVRAATDVTGFGLAGHAFALARSSGVGLRIAFDRLPVHDRFFELVAQGVTTRMTEENERSVAASLEDRASLDAVRREALFDPQTSGGLLLAVAPERAEALVEALAASGHRAAEVGEVTPGPPRLVII
jgi:selenide,water dikinase